MATLVTAEGYEDVYAQFDADLYCGLSGGGRLETGGNMAYSIPDANVVRIADGMLITEEGRTIIIPVGSYDDFQIPVGATGVTSYYILGYRLYTNGSNVRVAEQFVYTASSATDVPQNSGTLRDGAVQYYVSVYRVKQVGLTIDAVTPLIGILHPLTYFEDILDDIASLRTSLTSTLNAHFNQKGNTQEITPITVGFVTNSQKNIEFMIPLKKPLSTSVGTVRIRGLYATIRQNGRYIWGNASNRSPIDPEELTVYDTRGGIRVRWAHGAVINANAVNNDVCVLDVSVTLTLS